MIIWIGYDHREPVAFEVLAHSIQAHASKPVTIQKLDIQALTKKGLIKRPFCKISGRFYDPISDAPASTEFAISRFLAPLLQQSGWGIFMDCDMAFTGDIWEIMEELDPKYAVQCVKHDHNPTKTVKMDNQEQTRYSRKNWSSFFAFNADHPSNHNLTQWHIDNWPGRILHGFHWLEDEEIGELSPGWNWLVNEQDKPEPLWNAHFTNGGPWFPDWERQPNDQIWNQAYQEYKRDKHWRS